MDESSVPSACNLKEYESKIEGDSTGQNVESSLRKMCNISKESFPQIEIPE